MPSECEVFSAPLALVATSMAPGREAASWIEFGELKKIGKIRKITFR